MTTKLTDHYRLQSDGLSMWLEEQSGRSYKRVSGYFENYTDLFMDMTSKRWLNAEGSTAKKHIAEMKRIEADTKQMIEALCKALNGSQ